MVIFKQTNKKGSLHFLAVDNLSQENPNEVWLQKFPKGSILCFALLFISSPQVMSPGFSALFSARIFSSGLPTANSNSAAVSHSKLRRSLTTLRKTG